MKTAKSGSILNKALKRIQEQSPGYSVRRLAKKVGVSHVFMSKVLRGERELPPKRLKAVSEALKLDDLAIAELKTALKEKASLSDPFFDAPRPTSRSSKRLSDFSEKGVSSLCALQNWYDLPLLDLLTCRNDMTVDTLASALGISGREVETSVAKLARAGLLKIEDGRLRKTEENIRFPLHKPTALTKSYYLQVLKRAAVELQKQSQSDYERRLISNLSLSVAPDKIPIAKQKLQAFLYDLSLELSSGESSQVYFLTTALIPVSKDVKS